MPPPPPTPLIPPPNQFALLAGTRLYRTWNGAYPINAFNPGLGNPTRFSPLRDSSGGIIPTLYAASSLACALHERVFHEVPHSGIRSVHLNNSERLWCGIVEVRRDLTLAQLFRPDLEVWGLRREELVHTEADEYTDTVRWAEAIANEYPDIEGLVWTSNRCDPELTYLLFGDRVSPDDLFDIGEGGALVQHPHYLRVLREQAKRTGIEIVVS